jgi:hypothetical protein
MSKKDYVLISNVVRVCLRDEEQETAGYKAVERLAVCLAQTLELNNKRFSGEKFLIACGVNVE